jgi:hypothetical protein
MIDQLLYARAAVTDREQEVERLIRTSHLLRQSQATSRKKRAWNRWGTKLLHPILAMLGR